MNRRRYALPVLIALLIAPAAHAADRQTRPAAWAQPVRSAHVENFYRIDDKVYRSAQPDAKGFKELQDLGIRNVLSFRDHHSDTNSARGTTLKL
jgi:hypothetical protein